MRTFLLLTDNKVGLPCAQNSSKYLFGAVQQTEWDSKIKSESSHTHINNLQYFMFIKTSASVYISVCHRLIFVLQYSFT